MGVAPYAGGDGKVSRRQVLRTALMAAAGATAGWALAACGPAAKPAATKPKILLVWEPWRVNWGAGWDQIFYTYTEPFRKLYPGVDIKVSAPTSTDNDTLVQTEILGGSGPDVFSGFFPSLLLESNLTLDLKPYITEQQIDLSVFDAGQLAHFVTPNGIYGLPAELSTTAVLVNLGVLDNLGYARPSTTWTTAEAAKLWRQVTTPSRNGHAAWMSIASGLPGEYMWRSFGASIAEHNFSMHSALDSSAALDFANWFYPQVDAGIIALGTNMSNVYSGALVTATVGSWQLPQLATNMTGINWALYPAPSGPSGSTSYAGRDYYAVNVRTQHPKEAAAFLLWLTTSKEWLTTLIKLQLVIPPTRPYWSTWVATVQNVAPPLLNKNLEAFVSAAMNGKAYSHPDFQYQSDNAYALIGEYTQNIVNQTMSPQEALSQAVTRVYAFEKAVAAQGVLLQGVSKLLQQASASKTPITFPAPTPTGIGVPSSQPPSGYITHKGTTWTLVGDGSDVWGTSDNCTFACMPATISQARYTCRVTSLANIDCPHLSQWSKAGLMVRMDLSDDTTMMDIVVSGGNGVFIDTRDAPGASAAQQSSSPTATTGLVGASALTKPENPKTPHQNRLLHPIWLRLERKDATWTAFTSSDGTTWTQAGSPMTLEMAGAYIGLCCTSHNDSFSGNGRIQATFDNVQFTPTLPVQLGSPGGS
jgi:ABC-type glycerol-3-phosphate transport system substrate-binding protein